MKRKKVGIMGGTFDPIHVGHLILGESAYHQFALDKVLFMPSGNPPHKRSREGRATLIQRIEMVRLAIEGNPHFELSLDDACEEGYSYTKQTLERLTSMHPDTDYYFIMGADSLFSFEEWNAPERISQLAVIVAAVRDHVEPEALQRQVFYLQQKFAADIRLLSTPNMDISSQMLRDWIQKKRSLRYYMPDKVLQYIEEHGIYQMTDSSNGEQIKEVTC